MVPVSWRAFLWVYLCSSEPTRPNVLQHVSVFLRPRALHTWVELSFHHKLSWQLGSQLLRTFKGSQKGCTVTWRAKRSSWSSTLRVGERQVDWTWSFDCWVTATAWSCVLAPGSDADIGANANRLEHQPPGENADSWGEGDTLSEDRVYMQIYSLGILAVVLNHLKTMHLGPSHKLQKKRWINWSAHRMGYAID